MTKFVCVVFYLLIFASITSAEVLTIVQARVQNVSQALPLPDSRDEQDKLEGLASMRDNNAWIAELKIEMVFSGDTSLLGEFMRLNTRNEIPPGNANPIVPLLKKGELGIFAVKKFSDGDIGSPAYGLPELPEGQLPLIKGRHSGYDKAITRLTGVNAHRNSATLPKQSQPSDDSNNYTSSPSLPLKQSKPSNKVDDPPSSILLRWGIFGVVILAVTTLFFVFRSKTQ